MPGLDRQSISFPTNKVRHTEVSANESLPMTPIKDNINPQHYKSHPSKVECIAITRHYNFNVGNAIKYLWRQGLKDSSPAIEDLQKAVWYIEDEIERIKRAQDI